ncbi:MAG: helix-turn-helix transcriptional regulator [Rhodobacteraceae bacterium]|nr:helix-turn-helix transcriptional regulator [Paracoccaceae bacterium]
MSQFPETLKTWRARRRLSQLDLSLEADVSTRHISFLETGRAQPSREMIGRLGDALQMPLDARNQMLTHAGFAVMYPGRKWDSGEMAPIRKAVELTLANHMPFPGLALDRLWTIRQMNGSAAWLYGQFGVGIGDSLLDLLMSETLPSAVENWPDVARHAAARLRTESLRQGGVPEFDRVIRHLSSVDEATLTPPEPVVPTVIRMGENRLSMFATIAQFGTPEDVTLDDLKIELYFPMDAPSEALLRSMGRD